ncbi:MAG TPA: HlyD family efflux transporter periplasmic adaptor subunit [Candidatus Dormibacteraeota bacterium]
MLRRIGLAAAVAVLLAVAAALFATGEVHLPNFGASASAGDRSSAMLTTQAVRITLRDTSVLTGTASHVALGTLRAAGPGRVTRVDVDEGKTVNAGDELFQIDGRPVIAVNGDFPFWQDLKEGASGADVAQLKDMLRGDGFYPSRAVSDQTFDSTTTTALKAWQKRHGFTRDGVLKMTDTQVAGWPARIGPVKVRMGDFVGPGMELTSVVSTQLQIHLSLSAADRQKLQVGQPVQAQIVASGKTATGTITALDNSATTDAQGNKTYGGTVSVASGLDVLDGSSVKVTVIIQEVKNAVAVPVAAVVTDATGKPEVRVQDATGRIRSVQVVTGLTDAAYTEIKSGLSGGETVVLGPKS